MGVQISDIIPKKEISMKELRGKTIAIDAYVALYQFLTTIRQMDGTPLMDSEGEVTSHLSGLFYRVVSLLEVGIKPVFVFDGKPPELKAQEILRRKEAKKVAEEKYEEAKDKKDVLGMRKFSARTVKITDKILEESKELLGALGVPVVQAPGEGEAEAASLAKSGKVWAAASQDYDSILYGTPYLIRNLTSARRRKLPNGLYIDVKPELIEFQDVLNKLGLDRDQLICLAILVGTDYNPGGVKGLGQKKALDIVQRNSSPFEIFKYVSSKFDFIFDWQEIFRQFREYEVNHNGDLVFGKVDEGRVKELLMKRDFSEARIESSLAKLRKVEEAKKQKGLSDFF
jgi:flap endonuclease-1